MGSSSRHTSELLRLLGWTFAIIPELSILKRRESEDQSVAVISSTARHRAQIWGGISTSPSLGCGCHRTGRSWRPLRVPLAAAAPPLSGTLHCPWIQKPALSPACSRHWVQFQNYSTWRTGTRRKLCIIVTNGIRRQSMVQQRQHRDGSVFRQKPGEKEELS